MKILSVISCENELKLKMRRFFALALCCFIGICLIAYPQNAKDSINAALKNCAETVVASLFPFMFLSSFMTNYGLTGEKSRILRFASEKLFGICPVAISVFFMSALGGFPVGAKMTKELLEKNSIGKINAQRLIFSCVNPSPSFAISAVGLCIFGSAKTGMLIYSSVVLSNMILFFLSRFILGSDGEILCADRKTKKERFSVAFVNAGKSSSEAMISICCYVLIFSCICDIMKCFSISDSVLCSLSGMLEVTIGCQRLSYLGNVPLIAGIIGWGGLSVHFQIMDCIEKSGLDLKLFFASRATCAFLSVVICDALLKIFPTVTQTVSLRSDLILKQTEKSIPVSIVMLLACFIFLIGDYTVRIGKKS